MKDNENNFKNDRNFCDEVGEISKGDDCKVDEELIRGKFDDIHEKIINHDERLSKIEVGMVQQQEAMKYVIKNQEEISNDLKLMDSKSTTNNNLILGSLNSLILNKQNNETKIETAIIDGKSKVYIQICILIGSIIATGGTVYVAMK